MSSNVLPTAFSHNEHQIGVCACPACDARQLVDAWQSDQFTHLRGLLRKNAPSDAPEQARQHLEIELNVDPNQGMFNREWTLAEVVIWLARNPSAIRGATVDSESRWGGPGDEF